MSCECAGSTAAFEAAGRGPIPRWGVDCPRSVAEARDSAKVEDQVRLLAGALADLTTLEPDGQAAACKAVPSGFDSRRRLFFDVGRGLLISDGRMSQAGSPVAAGPLKSNLVVRNAGSKKMQEFISEDD